MMQNARVHRYAGGICAIVLVLALICGGRAIAAAPVLDGPRLAVVKVSLFPFRYDLETVDETGALPLRLAGGGSRKRPLPEPYIAPSWSPDGSEIAFVGLARNYDVGPRGVRVYVSQADGSGIRPLPGTHGADEPVFTPDGASIAFGRARFRPAVNRRGEKRFVARGESIWLGDSMGDNQRRLTPERRGVFMWPESFTPDGSTLLANRYVGSHPLEVVEIQLGSGRIKTLLRHAIDPVYSPDGSKIALIHQGHLSTMNAGGGGLRRLTSGRHSDYFPSWDPSGERLAFVSYPLESTELAELGFGSALMQVNADGTCLRTVLPATPSTGLFGAAWQPGPGREAGRIAC
jgi:Tol biopolymer transport system component